MMDVFRYFNEAEANEESRFNIFLQYAVIKNLYKYLNLQEIQKCRFVCREWNSSSSLFIRARSKIVFYKDSEDIDSNFVPSQFLDYFSGNINIPFKAFKFQNGNWTLEELSEFFASQQTQIKELELFCINILDENGKMENNFDLTRITKPCSKMRVSCYKGYTNMTIPLETLVVVEDLLLCGCRVNFIEGIKISPIKLSLENIRVYQDGYAHREMCINDIVDFSKSKQVSMECINHTMANTLFTLDLLESSKPVNLDVLSLHSITVVNWFAVGWTINQLDLWDVSMVEKIGCQFKKLSFKFSEIDLGILPQSIENLSIQCISEMSTRVFCSQPISLVNITCLHLGVTNRNYTSVISHFKNCPNLVRVHFEGCASIRFQWELEWIPKSVKVIKFTCFLLETLSPKDKPFHLQKLIIYDRKYESVKTIFENNIVVDDLILYCFDEGPDAQQNFLNFLKKKWSSIRNRVVAGPFKWIEHESHPIKNNVDREAEYYLFQNQKGVAITEREFQKFSNFAP